MSFQPNSQYKHSIYPLFFLMLLILAQPSPAQAYYLIQSPEPFTMRGEREEAPPSDQKGIFTVQDNFNLFTRQDGTSPILLPHSDNFIAADTIDVNIPIFAMFSHPSQPGKDPLANMLYANLQIKKILEEYAAIQKRANELLSHSRNTMSSGKINIDTASDKSLHMTVEKPQDEQSTIRQELEQLQTLMTSANSTLPESTRSATAQNSSLQAADKKLVLTFRELHKQVAQQSSSLNKTSKMSHSTQTGKISTQNRLKLKLYNPPDQNTAQKSQSRPSYSGSGEISLPWILELPFKIFNFMLAHKIIAIIVFLVLLMLFNLIFGARS